MIQVAFAFMNAKATYCINVSNDFLLEIKFTVLNFREHILTDLFLYAQLQRRVQSNHILTRNTFFKCLLSGLRQFLISESPLKMMQNAFYCTLKALFILKIFKFLP